MSAATAATFDKKAKYHYSETLQKGKVNTYT